MVRVPELSSVRLTRIVVCDSSSIPTQRPQIVRKGSGDGVLKDQGFWVAENGFRLQ